MTSRLDSHLLGFALAAAAAFGCTAPDRSAPGKTAGLRGRADGQHAVRAAIVHESTTRNDGGDGIARRDSDLPGDMGGDPLHQRPGRRRRLRERDEVIVGVYCRAVDERRTAAGAARATGHEG